MSQSKPYPPAPGKPVAAPAKPGTPAPSAAMPRTSRPGVAPAPVSAKPTTAPAESSKSTRPGAPQPGAQRTGKVTHDKRGNAVWDFLAQTGRLALESTTRLLKKLETPELKMEQTHEEELRIAPDSKSYDQGGGYDPYNQATKPRK